MRFVKHEFFMDDDLPNYTHVARLLFIGLWTLADREGRLEDKPAKIKAMLFPYEQVDIEDLLAQLSCKFLTRYKSDGKSFIQINNFLKHQRPHVKEPASTIPAPEMPVQAPEIPGLAPTQNAGSLVLGSGSLRVGSGYNNRAPSAVDFSEVRFPYGNDKGRIIADMAEDECKFYLQDGRLGSKVRNALKARIEAKEAERV